MTTPATEINTIGLPANAQGAKVFAAQLRNFIMTGQLSSTGTSKNLAPRR